MGDAPTSPGLGLRRAWARHRYWVIPVVLLVAIASAKLDQGGFRSDTGRYSAVGVQAWREGRLLDLHLQPDVPYYKKPPLALWIHGLVLHLTGVHVWAARLPALLASAGCVGLLASIMARLRSRQAGLASGFVLALTYEYFRRTREISLDIWQLLFMLAAVRMVVGVAARARDGAAPVRGWFWRVSLAGVPLGLALLTKPLASLLALPVLAAWMLVSSRRSLVPGLVGMAVVAAATAAPWHIAMVVRHGEGFTGSYFGSETIGRALGEIKSLPPTYYVSIIVRTYWPWLIVLAFAVAWWWRAARRDPAALFAVLWAFIWLVTISIFPDKYPRYALPVYAGFGGLCGLWVARAGPQSVRGALVTFRRWWIAALAIGAVLWIVPIRFQAPHDPSRAEIIAFLGTTPRDDVWTWGLSDNDVADLFLGLGWWPREGTMPDGSLSAEAPEGALVITRRGKRGNLVPPGDVVFTGSDGLLTLTRLDRP